jgi:hypothetical protein
MRFLYGLIFAGSIVVIADLCLVYWALNNGPDVEVSYELEER